MMRYDQEEDDGDNSWLMREDATGNRSWRDLQVYRAAHASGVQVHQLSLRLPKYELYETGSQIRRSATSVSANIVEGFGRRRYKAEFIRFLIFAYASLDETQEHLIYINDCHPELEDATTLLRVASELGRRLNRFISSVEAHHRP